MLFKVIDMPSVRWAGSYPPMLKAHSYCDGNDILNSVIVVAVTIGYRTHLMMTSLLLPLPQVSMWTPPQRPVLPICDGKKIKTFRCHCRWCERTFIKENIYCNNPFMYKKYRILFKGPLTQYDCHCGLFLCNKWVAWGSISVHIVRLWLWWYCI